VNAQTGTTYTVVDADRAKLVTHTNGSAIAVTLPQAGSGGGSFAAGWFYDVQNRGVGTATITPTTSTIDGSATLALTTGTGVRIFSDGTNYFTQRGQAGNTDYTGSTCAAGTTATSISAAGVLTCTTNAQVIALVTADVSHATTNTTLSNITGLSLAVAASSTEMWGFTCQILATSNGAAADFDFGWTVPASTTITWLDLPSSGAALGATPGDATSTLQSFGGRNGTTIISFNGTIFVGGTSGTVQLQFAQHASSANTTIASKGSWCRFTRLAT
jgi:hypothetical protein